MASSLSYAALSRQLGTTFWLATNSRRQALELIEVSPLRSDAVYESFAIVLRSPPGYFIPQATYCFDHETLGAVDLFVVPFRQDQHGLYYEANFNIVRNEAPHEQV